MTTYSKLNVIYRLQKWMDSVPGQTFLNYAYSWGASIVILGTLFKLTHLPGANFFLFLGMGTEVFVFFIAAFDRPFDKTTDGMDLDLHPMEEGEGLEPAVSMSGVTGGGGTVIINGGGSAGRGGVSGETADREPVGGGVVIGGTGAYGGAVIAGTGVHGGVTGGDAVPGAVVGNGEEAARWEGEPISFAEGGTGAAVGAAGRRGISGETADSERAAGGNEALPMAEELKDATTNYIEELNRLTEMLSQVSEQSQRLTRDSEEMENLNRTLTGISRVYEMQLKSASAQIGTIDEINEQTRHMAEQIMELNRIYARMIEAMQVRANI